VARYRFIFHYTPLGSGFRQQKSGGPFGPPQQKIRYFARAVPEKGIAIPSRALKPNIPRTQLTRCAMILPTDNSPFHDFA
jgi:hypothetical protein